MRVRRSTVPSRIYLSAYRLQGSGSDESDPVLHKLDFVLLISFKAVQYVYLINNLIHSASVVYLQHRLNHD